MAKNKSNKDKLSDPGFLSELWQQIKMVYYLMMDRDVPIYLKVVPLLALIYLISPIDFVPDAFLGLGQMDDLAILLVGAKVFIELAPQNVVESYLRQMRGTEITGVAEDVAGAEKQPDQLDEVIIEGDFEPWDDSAEASN